jgi:tetratricopeptide (TPR) repeat protein
MDDLFARYQLALRAGHQLASEGKFKDALAQYEDAARVADERALPHIGIGAMHLRLGKPKDAVAAYERALVRDPNNLDALAGRASALLAAGRRADAAAAQQQIAALRAAPPAPAGVPEALLTPRSRAESLAMAGEEASAAGRRDDAIDSWLAEAREHAGNGHFDAALDAALRALAIDTGSRRVHLELTRLCFERGWTQQGAERVEALQRLLVLAPSDEIGAALTQLAREFAQAPPLA